jgi:hypothetical protein
VSSERLELGSKVGHFTVLDWIWREVKRLAFVKTLMNMTLKKMAMS